MHRFVPSQTYWIFAASLKSSAPCWPIEDNGNLQSTLDLPLLLMVILHWWWRTGVISGAIATTVTTRAEVSGRVVTALFGDSLLGEADVE
jgi:hypothetical protein